MNPRKRKLSARTIAAIKSEYEQGDMPFYPMAENKHWRDNRMYFVSGLNRRLNRHYYQCLIAVFAEEYEPNTGFWPNAVEHFKHDDINVVWCNVYNAYALHFITDESKLEFLLRHGKEDPLPFPLKGIKIPMIRRIIPSLIAADIVAVQPMMPPGSVIFSTKHGLGMTIKKDDNEQP